MTELPTIDCFEVALHTTTKDIYCNNIYIYICVCIHTPKYRIFASRKFPKTVALTAKKRCACAMCDLNLAGAVRWLQVDFEYRIEWSWSDRSSC